MKKSYHPVDLLPSHFSVPSLPPPDNPHLVLSQNHGIPATSIHPHVRYVCHWLQNHGHYAWVVGGAVRDLLLGQTPKDFDVATSAHHGEVKKIFRNVRIIGRRFRLALLDFPRMQIEVSSFRGTSNKSPHTGQHQNTMGTPREDALRRDFTINAMALDPMTMTIIDYIQAQPDLKARNLRTITAPEESFHEDPVRMIRAVRFEQRLGFTMCDEMRDSILQLASLLNEVSRHRLNEEMQRFLSHGFAVKAFAQFCTMGLLEPLMGVASRKALFASAVQKNLLPRLQNLLKAMDAFTKDAKEMMAPTVSLLAILFVITHGAVQKSMLGLSTNAKGRMPHANLPELLVQWGLLNGQVEPAVEILQAARALLDCMKRGRAPATCQERGVREGWLLLLALRNVLTLDKHFLSDGQQLLSTLPDLPILDHRRMVLC